MHIPGLIGIDDELIIVDDSGIKSAGDVAESDSIVESQGRYTLTVLNVSD